MTDTEHGRLLQVAHEVVDDAKEIFLHSQADDRTPKGDRDFATAADFAIEHMVRERLATATPKIGFLGEENGRTGDDERWWCLDPIDGTVNFASGSPLCAISLALIEEGQPVLGIIDAPLLGERYVAQQGQGATKDGVSIHVRSVVTLSEAILSFGDFATGADYRARYTEQRRLLDSLAKQVQRVRMLGTAALDMAWLAEGRHAASLIMGGKLWDVAAGQAIAQEAGAVILRSAFEQHDATIACASGIQRQVSELVDAVLGSPALPG